MPKSTHTAHRRRTLSLQALVSFQLILISTTLLLFILALFVALPASAKTTEAKLTQHQTKQWMDIVQKLMKKPTYAKLLDKEDWRIVSFDQLKHATIVTLANATAINADKEKTDGAAWLKVTYKQRQVPVCPGAKTTVTYEKVDSSFYSAKDGWSVSTSTNRYENDGGKASTCKNCH